MDIDVLVVGSVNQDRRIAVRRIVAPGQTVLADRVRVSGGGKGANQAAAAARAGARVALVGAVGDDEAGRVSRTELSDAGVDVDELKTVVGVPTGTAIISVADDGENAIIVDAGANAYTSLELHHDELDATVVLAQAEVPMSVVAESAALAAASGARFVFNAAPAPDALTVVPEGADPLVVNEHEAAELLGVAEATTEIAARALREASGSRSIVITLGADGCLVADASGVVTVPGVPAPAVVDTTGAGDAFVGTLAARLALGDDLLAATRFAVAAGSAAVGWVGARPPLDAAAPL